MDLHLIIRDKTTPLDDAAAQRKIDRAAGRKAANDFAMEALLFDVATMRDVTVDMKYRQAASGRIQNRAWGTPKAEESEDPKLANKSILDVFEQLSAEAGMRELEARRKALEQQPTVPAPVHPVLEAEYVEVMDDAADPRSAD